MHTSRLTSTLRLASRRDPAARLVLTTAGSSCGVMPTAIASENSTESMSGRCSTRLMTKMSDGQGHRDLQQQQREPAQPGLELGLGLALAQPERRCGRTRRSTPVANHPDPFTGADDGAHERQIRRIASATAGHWVRRLLAA